MMTTDEATPTATKGDVLFTVQGLDERYARTIRIAKRDCKITDLFDNIQGKKWMRLHFPEMSKGEHLVCAWHQRKLAALAQDVWNWTVRYEHLKVFGREYEVSDYRISGIAREEYDDVVKDLLRTICRRVTLHRRAAGYHYIMSGHRTAHTFLREPW